MSRDPSTQIINNRKSNKVKAKDIHVLCCLFVLNQSGQLKKYDSLRKLSGEILHKSKSTNIRTSLSPLQEIGAIKYSPEPLDIQVNEKAKEIIDQMKDEPKFWEQTNVKNKMLLKDIFYKLGIELPYKQSHYFSWARLLFVSLAIFQIIYEISFLQGKSVSFIDSVLKITLSGILLVLFLLPRISVINYKDKKSF